MNKQNVVYIYGGVLFNIKRNKNLSICYNINELKGIMLSEISQWQKEILHDSTYIRYLKYSDSQEQKIKW